MAQTGVDITVKDTVLGAPPQVNSNSFLLVIGATAVTSGNMAFSLDVPVMLTSASELTLLGITKENNPDVYQQVNDFYAPKPGLNISGTILWLMGSAKSYISTPETFLAAIQKTVANGFQYRPRQIIVSIPNIAPATETDLSDLAKVCTGYQAHVDLLYKNGYSTVFIVGSTVFPDISTGYATMKDLSMCKAGQVGAVIVSKRQGDRASVGAVGGWMSTLSVGTSIGDGSMESFASQMYYVDGVPNEGEITWVNTPCSGVSETLTKRLGSLQYVFARTAPPENGLWFNDGATANEAVMALSTWEAGRTIASIADDTRLYFKKYVNVKIPVADSGDILPTYKKVVLDGAFSKILQPYIDNGDISNGRISLKAVNDDMVGTRTWEVSISVLPAPTLRWVDGSVFYVKSL